MYNYKAVWEVEEYNGIIFMVQRWNQELLVYHFTVIHWSEKMMGDDDALTRRFGEIFFCTYV